MSGALGDAMIVRAPLSTTITDLCDASACAAPGNPLAPPAVQSRNIRAASAGWGISTPGAASARKRGVIRAWRRKHRHRARTVPAARSRARQAPDRIRIGAEAGPDDRGLPSLRPAQARTRAPRVRVARQRIGHQLDHLLVETPRALRRASSIVTRPAPARIAPSPASSAAPVRPGAPADHQHVARAARLVRVGCARRDPIARRCLEQRGRAGDDISR